MNRIKSAMGRCALLAAVALGISALNANAVPGSPGTNYLWLDYC